MELFLLLFSDLTDKKWFSRSVSHKQERPVGPLSHSLILVFCLRAHKRKWVLLVNWFISFFTAAAQQSPIDVCCVCALSPLRVYLFMCHLTEFLWSFVMFHSRGCGGQLSALINFYFHDSIKETLRVCIQYCDDGSYYNKQILVLHYISLWSTTPSSPVNTQYQSN